MENPQTTIALTFLTHIISDIDGVATQCHTKALMSRKLSLKSESIELLDFIEKLDLWFQNSC